MSSEPLAPLNNNETPSETTVVSHPVPVERQLPIDSVITGATEREDGNPKLRETAETVGTAVGKAVNKVRDLPRRVSEMKERFTVIRGRTREDASSAAAELKENARQKAYQARSRAQYYAREFPLEFLAGVAGVAFVLGFALRIWRSSRRG
jgi:hypothetical protein